LGAALTAMIMSSTFGAPAGAQVLEVGPAGVVQLSKPEARPLEGAPGANPRARYPGRLSQAAPILDRAGAAADLSPLLLQAVAYVESRFDTDAVSPRGALGMMQLMPGTAKDLGVDPSDPEDNARGGADYLRLMLVRFDGNVELALAAYNAGPSAVLRHGGVPPYRETRAYVDAVMDYLARTSMAETE